MKRAVTAVSVVLVLSMCLSGCVQAAMAVGGQVGARVANRAVVNARSGSVVLDSLAWLATPGDSASYTARGLLTWKKASAGPNNTTYLNLAGNEYETHASGGFQFHLLDANGNVLTTLGPAKVTVWDGNTPITMIPADKAFRFEARSAPAEWNIRRDAMSKGLRFAVVLR